MAERRWTDAQKNAIEDTGGALLVSAAAGSGKTAVLVERAVRMITRADAPVSAERLLILTFTNAAADELRSRIARRLEECLRAEPGNLALKKQKLMLKRAFIGTIDAFCIQLVQEHFARLDIAPDVTVGDGALLAQLGEAALAATLEEMYADEDFARFAALYGRARSDGAAAETVQALYAFTRTLPNPTAQLDRLAAMYTGGCPLAETAWGQELLATAADALAYARARLAEGMATAQTGAGCEGYLPALEHPAAAFAAMEAAVRAGSWDEAAALVGEYKFPAFRPARGADEAAKASLTAARDAAKEIQNRLKKYCFVCTEAEFEEDLAAAGPMVEALVKAAQLYAERFWQSKKAERVLDFADIEHLALGLLQSEDGQRTPLAERVAGRYDVVMVDEYQDTNELQSALYECLASPDGSNLFYVGDVKQSIYRFRQANPGIFLEKRRSWAPFGSGSHPAVITLGHNFRSTSGVVDGVNGLFGQLMSAALGEVDYTSDERLIYGADYTQPGGVELAVIEGDDAGEAAYVAGRIASMVENGATVEEDGVQRPAGYGDFCILLRSHARMGEFAAALAARGVPAVAAHTENLLDTPEVLPMVAALSAIDNPGNDVMLAAAMLGPLFRFTPDEMTAIRAGRPRGRLWGAVAASALPKAQRFVEELQYYRTLAVELSVGRLCEELAGATGYTSAVAAMESGSARRENLDRFMAWAAAVGRSGRGGLAGFVRLLAGGRGPEAPGAKAIPGHVSLLSIHRSKGLEFPFCFVCDADRPFNQRELAKRVKLHAGLGIGLSLRSGDVLYPTLPALAIRSRMLREGMSEEMRVWYVALTRARQQAVVTFAAADPDALLRAKAGDGVARRLPAYGLLAARSPAAWLLSAAVRHPAGRALMTERLGVDLPVPAGGWAEAFTFSILPPPPAPGEKPAFALTAAPDEALAAALGARFGAAPAREALALVPAKVSVSAIAKPAGAGPLRRPSLMYAAGLTAAEKGTAQHAFMQFADFTAAQTDPAAELRRLVEGAWLDEATAKAVDLAGVRAFFAAPLFQRVAAAQKVLREYDFITSVPAGELQPGLPEALAAEPVLVQGIADLVLVGQNTVEIVDYKTDRGKTPKQLAETYAGQLALYAAAVEKRLGLPVGRCTIWSFELAEEVEVE